ncbi:uncharacterized protein [Primulina eburnea]|uniref:uncharacterized protein n=1 Tax=Primulina eburnea TaxID=1245227 RepID=UPI003C6C02B7
MEGLENLEKVQKAIHLLRSIGVPDADPYSLRFLADFALLLLENYDGLDLTSKCQLILENMSKISAALSGEKGGHQIENAVRFYHDDKANLCSVWSVYDDVAMVGLDAMKRSNSSLEDFCRSYFMFHTMEANEPQSIFRYLPFLSFTESYIYQLDGLNEKLLLLSNHEVPIMGPEFEVLCRNLDGEKSVIRRFSKEPFRPLCLVLERHGLLTERIKEELKCGEEYWALERKLCGSLVSNKKISIEDVTRAIHLKSFDYRVLNLLLYQLRVAMVNEAHMEFLSVSELLVEISDDLFDYEDDVAENHFNILRMYVRYYGASAAPIKLAKFVTELEEKYDRLLKALGSELGTKYQKRCEEATKEGGKTCGPPLGTWHIPPVIEDEARYRTAISTISGRKVGGHLSSGNNG